MESDVPYSQTSLFSHCTKPLQIMCQVLLIIPTTSNQWTTGIMQFINTNNLFMPHRLGVTTRDPSQQSEGKFPPYSSSYLHDGESYWAKPLPKDFSNARNKISFYINQEGNLRITWPKLQLDLRIIKKLPEHIYSLYFVFAFIEISSVAAVFYSA